MIALALGGLKALESLDTAALRLSFVMRGVVGLALSLCLVEVGIGFAGRSPLAYLAGAESAGAYRRANLGWYAVAMETINDLPDGSHVLFLWEPRSLECVDLDRCDPDEIIDRWWHSRRTVGSATDILADWRSAGTTHVLVFDAGADFERQRPHSGLTDEDWQAFDAVRTQMQLVQNWGGAYSLYRVP